MAATLSSLPNEMKLEILGKLPVDDIVSLCKADTSFKHIFAEHHPTILQRFIRAQRHRMGVSLASLNFRPAERSFLQCLIAWDRHYGIYRLLATMRKGLEQPAVVEQAKMLLKAFAQRYLDHKGLSYKITQAFLARARVEGTVVDARALARYRSKIVQALMLIVADFMKPQRVVERRKVADSQRPGGDFEKEGTVADYADGFARGWSGWVS